MKKLLIPVLLMLVPILSMAQKPEEIKAPKMPVNEETKLVTYTSVKEVSATKAELYERALAWFNSFHKNPAEVIREKDEQNGRITGKGRFRINNFPDKTGLKTDAGLVQYSMTVSVKDGKYKYDVTEFNWKQTSYYPIEKWMDKQGQYYTPAFDYYLLQTDEYMNDLLKKFNEAMQTAPKKKQDDW